MSINYRCSSKFLILIKVSAIPIAILLTKSIGDTLSDIKKVKPILSQQYQYCDNNNSAHTIIIVVVVVVAFVTVAIISIINIIIKHNCISDMIRSVIMHVVITIEAYNSLLLKSSIQYMT